MSQARKHRRRKAQKARRLGRKVHKAQSLRANGFFGPGIDDVLPPESDWDNARIPGFDHAAGYPN